MKTFEWLTAAKTRRPFDLLDITGEVAGALQASRIGGGQVTVFAPDPSVKLLVNEKETGLFRDLKLAVSRVAASVADRRALLGSSSVVVPAHNGTLHLGPWQRILLVELEEPATREIVVQIVGE